MKILLTLTPEQSPAHRARITYAFRLFCSIHGHCPLVSSAEANSADAEISYSSSSTPGYRGRTLRLSNSYVPRSPKLPAPAPKNFERHGETTKLFYAPENGAEPDWLAEIFEWVSCADEYSCTERDSVGRLPFDKSYIGRHGLDPGVPYAAIAMQFLQRALARSNQDSSSAPAGLTGDHFVVNTHDVDFLSLSKWDSVHRLAKNSAISLLLYRNPLLALKQLAKAAKAGADGKSPVDHVLPVAQEENRRGIKSTYLFITDSRHRRDVNYKLSHTLVLDVMHALQKQQIEIGVHGSYTSMDEPSGLEREFGRLRDCGFDPKGNRQHWLRFSLDRLIPEMEKAGAIYDSSLGWSSVAGFRAGACFAFPPYFFDEERPAKFLEIPLILMDHHLVANGSDRYTRAAQLISTSKRYGWGGISVLWHPMAFGGGQLPEEVGDVFWRLIDEGKASTDKWVGALDFYNRVLQKYQGAGLLS